MVAEKIDRTEEEEEAKTGKVLVVIDMQNDFLTGPLGSEHCRAAVPEVVKLIKSGGWDRVLLTMDTHAESYPNTLEGRKLPVVHCIRDTEGWNNCKEVREAVESLGIDGHRIYTKPTFGHVYLPNLVFAATHREGDKLSAKPDMADVEIHMCGVCTSICVLANAVILRAHFPDTRIVIHSKACGDVNEEMHEHALAVLRAQQCDVED